MSNQSRSGTITLTIGVVSSTLFLCCGSSFAGSGAAQIASGRLQNIQTANAELKKQVAADWLAVIAADKAEVVSLNTATAAAMKAANPNAVVSAQGLLKTVQARLVSEKAEPPFPPYFQATTNTSGLNDPALKIETTRNEAVAAAVAQIHLAQADFHDAVVAADQNAIAQWKKHVAADMKADKPQAVVTDMSAMKQSQQQLQRDSTTVPGMLPALGMQNQAQPGYGPSGMLPNAGMLNPTIPAYRPPGFFPGAGHAMQGTPASEKRTSIGSGIASYLWPNLVKHAMRPVEWNSVPSLAAELSRLQSNPATLIGTKVAAYAEVNRRGDLVIKGSRGPRARLSPTDEMQVRNVRHQLVAQFGAVFENAHEAERAEYVRAAGQSGGVVPFAQQRREQIRYSKIAVPATREEQKDLLGVGIALRSPHNQIQLLAGSGSHPPAGGAVYGVIVGIRVIRLPIVIPSYSYEANPLISPMVSTRGFTLRARHQVYRVKLLYCGRAPKYISMVKKSASGPIKSYVFKMKSGTKMDATTYTTGDFYYHLKWNGIDLTVAKDLVVKIIPVR